MKKKKAVSKKIKDFEPTRVALAVSVVAVVSLVLFAIFATSLL